MRRMFTTAEARRGGVTDSALRWGERVGRWRRIVHGVYGEGPDDPTDLERAVARVIRAGTVARGRLAAVLHGLDGVDLDDVRPTPRPFAAEHVVAVDGVPCSDGFQTLVDLAVVLDDDIWEQALESALRRGLTPVAALEGALPELGRARTRGTARIRRVLALRPRGAPPTESLLETLMVQLARNLPGLAPPTRQYRVADPDGLIVARVDLCWPEIGLFIELDGQHHEGQPVHDARRETAIVAATGWLPGRFTWREVVHLRRTTTRRLAALVDQARRRPVGLAPSPAPFDRAKPS